MDDFAERSKAYAKRAKALDAANRTETAINGGLTLGTFLFIALAVIFMWSRLDAKVLVGIAVATFLLRWVANIIVRVVWTGPTMKRIDAEAPAPTPRQETPDVPSSP